MGTGYLERSHQRPMGSGNRVASYAFRKTGKMVSMPLPANRKPTFPFPYNLTLPLPEPTGRATGLPFGTICTRFIPCTPGLKSKWGLTQLTGMTWSLERGELWASKPDSRCDGLLRRHECQDEFYRKSVSRSQRRSSASCGLCFITSGKKIKNIAGQDYRLPRPPACSL